VERIAAESGYDPRAAATDLARRKLRTLARKPDEQAKQRALYALLARRGFDSDLCRDVVRTVLGEAEG
jgi:SOS response regulatory protein OraA/RecX